MKPLAMVDEENPDVYDALARKYLNIGCSCMSPNKNRLDLLDELIDDFHQAVDDYLELCKKSGQTPETAFKGSFNVRISPELHKKVFVYAMAHQISMNRYIEETLAKSPAALEEV